MSQHVQLVIVTIQNSFGTESKAHVTPVIQDFIMVKMRMELRLPEFIVQNLAQSLVKIGVQVQYLDPAYVSEL